MFKILQAAAFSLMGSLGVAGVWLTNVTVDTSTVDCVHTASFYVIGADTTEILVVEVGPAPFNFNPMWFVNGMPSELHVGKNVLKLNLGGGSYWAWARQPLNLSNIYTFQVPDPAAETVGCEGVKGYRHQRNN